MSNKRLGFARRDLLVLIVLFATVAGLLPSCGVQKVREAAARTQIMNNMKQLALAVHNTNDVYRKIPPGTGIYGEKEQTKPRSLSVHLLPYVGQQVLYVNIDANTSKNVVVPPFTAPLDFTTADFLRVQNFAANVRAFTDLGMITKYDADVAVTAKDTGAGSSSIPKSFPDGTENTIMFATRYSNTGAMGSGGNVSCSAFDEFFGKDNSAFFGVKVMTAPPSATSTGGWQLSPTLTQANCKFGAVAHSFGTAGIQVAMFDASVRTVSPTVSAKTWNIAMQPNDGNPLGPDW